VGLSSRTNASAVTALRKALPSLSVIPLPVEAGLHLKSVCSHLDERTIVVADTPFGGSVIESIKNATSPQSYDFVVVPDVVSSNILR